MHYIEPREVTIRVSNFEMEGTIQGNLDSFIYESSNSHFQYWFPEGRIDSLQLEKSALKKEQLEIVEACESRIRQLF